MKALMLLAAMLAWLLPGRRSSTERYRADGREADIEYVSSRASRSG